LRNQLQECKHGTCINGGLPRATNGIRTCDSEHEKPRSGGELSSALPEEKKKTVEKQV